MQNRRSTVGVSVEQVLGGRCEADSKAVAHELTRTTALMLPDKCLFCLYEGW